jgi:hypothetical protein
LVAGHPTDDLRAEEIPEQTRVSNSDRDIPRHGHRQECDDRCEQLTSTRNLRRCQPFEDQYCGERQQGGRPLGKERQPKGYPHRDPPTEPSLVRAKAALHVGPHGERLERGQQESVVISCDASAGSSMVRRPALPTASAPGASRRDSCQVSATLRRYEMATGSRAAHGLRPNNPVLAAIAQ